MHAVITKLIDLMYQTTEVIFSLQLFFLNKFLLWKFGNISTSTICVLNLYCLLLLKSHCVIKPLDVNTSFLQKEGSTGDFLQEEGYTGDFLQVEGSTGDLIQRDVPTENVL